MNRSSRRSIAALLLCCLARAALAQTVQAKAEVKAEVKAEEAPVPTVEVKASNSDYDPRRDDTASKTVINQEELRKYGDTNVYDVLKRAPGVTVTGNTIRMRGLGAGYTQILVNGERAPPGFSLDNLPPDQIEKIEIIRAATAEFSMQAIAGTINIVLKKLVVKPQRDLRLNGSAGSDSRNGGVSGTVADKAGNLSYYLTANLGHNQSTPEGTGGDSFTTPAGQVTQLRASRAVQENTSTALILQPRLNWKLANDDQLNASGFIQDIRADNAYASTMVNAIGSFGAPDYLGRTSNAASTIRFGGADLNWVAKLGGGKLDAKLTANLGNVQSNSASDYKTFDQPRALVRAIDNRSAYRTYTGTGKFTRSLFDTHSLATGWEVSDRKTEDHALRTDRLAGAAPLNVDERFQPEVVRVAVFAQDEWNITKLWSMYLGARWESIRLDSTGTGLDATQSTTHVLSPVAQTLYKFPDKSGRQVRLALTRTFKAPDVAQLTGRRSVAAENTRFSPDSSGNPNLQPELATGIDATYEHFWAPGALYSVGGSVRRIRGYIRTTLAQEADGLWLNSPRNDGNVQVRTLEMELKFPAKVVWKDAPALDVRASVNRNWSHVDAVPFPDNRLDAQLPLNATLGLDYRRDRLTTGASLAFRAGGPLRISEQQSVQRYRQRDLDAYMLVKFTPQYQLRVAVANFFGDANRSLVRYQDASGASESWSVSQTARRVQASLEVKL